MESFLRPARRLAAAAILAASAAGVAAPAIAETSAPSKAEIERVVREYLRENPEIIIEAFEAYKKKREAEEQAAIDAALKPELHDLPHGLSDFMIMPIEIRLFSQEGMKIVLSALCIPRPGR